MNARRVIEKEALIEQYEEILQRGCLDASQLRQLLDGQQVAGVVVQQSGGSGGEKPLRLPRTQAEMNWLAGKLGEHYIVRYGSLPERVAFLGGISHAEAQQRVEVGPNMELQDFAGDELADLDAFNPDIISTYPSFAREVAASSALRLQHVKSIKLGGEPFFLSDLQRLWDRFGPIPIVEQFGSTEMPGLAFRMYTPASDGGYELSVDRYEFDFSSAEGWQPLVVRDRFPDRAFPIESWYDTGDEALVREGTPVAFRRRGDETLLIRSEIDALLGDGCVNVQLFPRESRLLCARAPSALGRVVRIGDLDLEVSIEQPYRLVDSNKMPLLIDTQKIHRSRLFRYASSFGQRSKLL